jgi:magnesium-transporting ATPase (P-type)
MKTQQLSTLARLIDFTHNDLTANREGRISDRQVQRLRNTGREFTAMAWLFLFIVTAVIAAVWAFRLWSMPTFWQDQRQVTTWLAATVGVWLVAALVAFVFVESYKGQLLEVIKNDAVQVAQGIVFCEKTEEVYQDRYGNETVIKHYFVEVGTKKFEVSEEIYKVCKVHYGIGSNGIIYYVASPQIILSAE